MANGFDDLTPSQSHRLVPVTSAKVVPSIAGGWALVVEGTAPYMNMTVTLEPAVYIRQPEYWRIEVVGTIPGGIGLPATKPYVVSMPLAGTMGTKGVEVIGQNFAEQLPVPPDSDGAKRIYQVSEVSAAILESFPPQLALHALGTASTPGWTNPRLVELGEGLADDGFKEFEFVADPPEGMVLQVLTPIEASLVWKDYGAVEGQVKGVRVYSQTNSAEAALAPAAPGPDWQKAVKLRPNKPKQVDSGSLTLELTKVNDSRCPTNVVCVWQGKVDVTLQATPSGGAAESVVLSSTDTAPTSLSDGHLLKLIDVVPYPAVPPSKKKTAAIVLVMR